MPDRRAFLHQGTLFLSGLGGLAGASAADTLSALQPVLKVGLLTDLHYADKPPTKTRFYRETIGKLREAVDHFNRVKVDLVIELGDLIDQAPSVEQELAWLDEVEKVYATVKAPRHYVLGNHCVTTLTKAEFAAHTGASKSHHYSFDAGGVHFVVLDACYLSDDTPYGRGNVDWTDANVPAEELAWLRDDLKAASAPVVVLAHQRLDDSGKHSVRNAAEVRTVLEQSGRVAAVLQGHSHQNDLQTIQRVPYVTLAALIEGTGEANNSYGVLEVLPDGALRIRGYRRQIARDLRTPTQTPKGRS